MRTSDGVIWGWPTWDVFTGGAEQQDVMSRYYTLFHTPGALAANAMYQNWQQDARRHSRAGMVWVFPPCPLVDAVINKLLLEHVDAILILPRFMRYWAAMLGELPTVAVHELPYFAGLYTIGSRAPQHMQDEHNKPVYLPTAYRVKL